MPDDGALDMGVGDLAAVRDNGLADGGAVDLAGGQEPGVGVHGAGAVKKAVLRDRVGEVQVGIEEGADGADVLQ